MKQFTVYLNRRTVLRRADLLLDLFRRFQVFVCVHQHCPSLGNYYKYMRSNGVTIDFNQWMEHESSPLLAVLEYIQPVKDTDN